MKSKLVIISVLLGVAASAPAWAQVRGRMAPGASGTAARAGGPAEPTPRLDYPNSFAPPLTEENDILNEMSIFSKNRGTETGTPATRPAVPTRYVRLTPRPPAPVFRGAMIDDSGPVALMETRDAAGKTVSEHVRVGELFRGATVLSITLDTLRLSRIAVDPGQDPWIEVPIGCDLDGARTGTLPVVSGTYLAATATPFGLMRTDVASALGGGPGTGRATTVGSAGFDPPLPTGGADDLAARMAARRQMQLRGTTGGRTDSL